MFRKKVSVFEKAVILDHPIFFGGHKVILVTQSMKIVEKAKHIGIITFRGSTILGLGLPTEDA